MNKSFEMDDGFRPLRINDFYGKIRMYNIPVIHKGMLRLAVDVFIKVNSATAKETYEIKLDNGIVVDISELDLITDFKQYYDVVQILLKSINSQNA